MSLEFFPGEKVSVLLPQSKESSHLIHNMAEVIKKSEDISGEYKIKILTGCFEETIMLAREEELAVIIPESGDYVVLNQRGLDRIDKAIKSGNYHEAQIETMKIFKDTYSIPQKVDFHSPTKCVICGDEKHGYIMSEKNSQTAYVCELSIVDFNEEEKTSPVDISFKIDENIIPTFDVQRDWGILNPPKVYKGDLVIKTSQTIDYTEITGCLFIEPNATLKAPNLKKVGGTLSIYPKTILENLQTVGGNLDIHNETILESLKTVYGDLNIYSNGKLIVTQDFEVKGEIFKPGMGSNISLSSLSELATKYSQFFEILPKNYTDESVSLPDVNVIPTFDVQRDWGILNPKKKVYKGDLTIHESQTIDYTEITGFLTVNPYTNLKAPNLQSVGDLSLNVDCKIDAPELQSVNDELYMSENSTVEVPKLQHVDSLNIRRNAQINAPILKTINGHCLIASSVVFDSLQTIGGILSIESSLTFKALNLKNIHNNLIVQKNTNIEMPNLKNIDGYFNTNSDAILNSLQYIKGLNVNATLKLPNLESIEGALYIDYGAKLIVSQEFNLNGKIYLNTQHEEEEIPSLSELAIKYPDNFQILSNVQYNSMSLSDDSIIPTFDVQRDWGILNPPTYLNNPFTDFIDEKIIEKKSHQNDGWFYHSTLPENASNIMKKGLLPNMKKIYHESKDYVYVTSSAPTAISWGWWAIWGHKNEKIDPNTPLILFRFKKPEKYEKDESGNISAIISGNCYKIDGCVPPEELEVLTNDGWKPIVIMQSNPRTEIYHPKPKPKIYRIRTKSGKIYEVNSDGYFIRNNNNYFKPHDSWKFDGFGLIQRFGNIKRISLKNSFKMMSDETKVSSTPTVWKFKNGKPKYFIFDIDHGTLRVMSDGVDSAGEITVNPRTEIYHAKPKKNYIEYKFKQHNKIEVDDKFIREIIKTAIKDMGWNLPDEKHMHIQLTHIHDENNHYEFIIYDDIYPDLARAKIIYIGDMKSDFAKDGYITDASIKIKSYVENNELKYTSNPRTEIYHSKKGAQNKYEVGTCYYCGRLDFCRIEHTTQRNMCFTCTTRCKYCDKPNYYKNKMCSFCGLKLESKYNPRTEIYHPKPVKKYDYQYRTSIESRFEKNKVMHKTHEEMVEYVKKITSDPKTNWGSNRLTTPHVETKINDAWVTSSHDPITMGKREFVESALHTYFSVKPKYKIGDTIIFEGLSYIVLEILLEEDVEDVLYVVVTSSGRNVLLRELNGEIEEKIEGVLSNPIKSYDTIIIEFTDKNGQRQTSNALVHEITYELNRHILSQLVNENGVYEYIPIRVERNTSPFSMHTSGGAIIYDKSNKEDNSFYFIDSTNSDYSFAILNYENIEKLLETSEKKYEVKRLLLTEDKTIPIEENLGKKSLQKIKVSINDFELSKPNDESSEDIKIEGEFIPTFDIQRDWGILNPRTEIYHPKPKIKSIYNDHVLFGSIDECGDFNVNYDNDITCTRKKKHGGLHEGVNSTGEAVAPPWVDFYCEKCKDTNSFEMIRRPDDITYIVECPICKHTEKVQTFKDLLLKSQR